MPLLSLYDVLWRAIDFSSSDGVNRHRLINHFHPQTLALQTNAPPNHNGCFERTSVCPFFHNITFKYRQIIPIYQHWAHKSLLARFGKVRACDLMGLPAGVHPCVPWSRLEDSLGSMPKHSLPVNTWLFYSQFTQTTWLKIPMPHEASNRSFRAHGHWKLFPSSASFALLPTLRQPGLLG